VGNPKAGRFVIVAFSAERGHRALSSGLWAV
jgi:hypothetical protein